MFIFKRPPALLRSPRPLVCVTESLPAASSSSVNTTDTTADTLQPETNALVLDARKATSLQDLNWLYHTAQKYSNSNAFRKPGGRAVILRSCPSVFSQNNTQSRIEAETVSEALVGFAKSLAKENGSRGATVNLIRDACLATTDDGPLAANDDDNDDESVKGPLQWFLSSQSCYVTGQEMVVTDVTDKSQFTRKQSNADEGAVMITGAAGAIGKATAEFLHADQQHGPEKPTGPKKFLLIDHPSVESKLNQLAESLINKSLGGPYASSPTVEVLPLDVTQEDAGEIVANAGMEMGGVERVIHAAGITRDKTLRKMDYESSWRPVLKVNLEASFSMDQALLSAPGALWNTMNGASSSASFVYISSTSGIAGNAGQTNYAASKSGLLGYAKAMSDVYPQHRFHVVSPGFIETEMTQKMPFLVRLVASRLNALGQAGQPEDVAAAIAFLSSRDAIGLAKGSNLRVCGLFIGGR